MLYNEIISFVGVTHDEASVTIKTVWGFESFCAQEPFSNPVRTGEWRVTSGRLHYGYKV